jgi:hypothetical protein
MTDAAIPFLDAAVSIPLTLALAMKFLYSNIVISH